MVSLNIQQGIVVGGNHAPPFGGGDGGGASCGASWLVRFYLIIFNANFTTCSTGRSGCSARILTTTFADGAGEKPNIVNALTASSLIAALTAGVLG